MKFEQPAALYTTGPATSFHFSCHSLKTMGEISPGLISPDGTVHSRKGVTALDGFGKLAPALCLDPISQHQMPLMKNSQPAGITLIPTAAFFAAPMLYGIALGLQTVFPVFGDQFIFVFVMIVFPCLLPMSLLTSGMRLLFPPRTWTLGFAVLINLVTTAFALAMTWLVMTFPEQH